ncbi:MAG: NRDE family protein, partial [Phycisphaerales bacterium]|nr:NRDE family protein [Phycisphaerales bacterium]
MCTVTLVRPAPGSLRLVFNRDEQRSRAASTPPREFELAGRRALMPIDPDSGGTWIGASDAGVVACLLNANPPTRSAEWAGRKSRGLIVPAILAASGFDEARQIAWKIEAGKFPPFRLLVV